MDIAEILTRSGQLFWKHKVLGLMGLLAVLPMAFLLFVSFASTPFLFAPLLESSSPPPILPWVITLANVVIFAFVLVGVLAMLICQNGITFGVVQADAEAEGPSLSGMFRGSLPYFWRVLGVRLIYSVAFFAVYIAVILFIGVIGAVTFGIGLICVFPLFFLLIPAMLFAIAVMEQSEVSLITQDLRVMDAIRNGWRLVVGEFWRFVLLALIIYFVLGFILGLVTVPVMIPFYIPFFSLLSNNGHIGQGTILLTTTAMCIAAPLFALAQGIFLSFSRTVWTVTNLRLTGRGPELAQPDDSQLPQRLEPLDA